MKLKVAIQMDHVSTIDIDGDSTFVLGLEAERRGYDVWHYTPKDLVFRDRKVIARAQPMKLRREKGNHFPLGAPELVDLASLAAVRHTVGVVPRAPPRIARRRERVVAAADDADAADKSNIRALAESIAAKLTE